MRRHQKSCPEPDGERQMRPMHNGASGHRILLPALGADKGKHLPAGRPPGFFCVAARAAEAVRPAPVSQIGGASRIVREPLLEFAQGAGEVSHERALRCLCSWYVLTIRRLLRHLHMVAIRPTGFRGISNSRIFSALRSSTLSEIFIVASARRESIVRMRSPSGSS